MARLTSVEQQRLRAVARYEGSPFHKSNPGDFGLIPPRQPRPDKTLCDEAGVFRKSEAEALFQLAIDQGLVSESTAGDDFPKQIWVMDGQKRVFELMYTSNGLYHGYPIRSTDPLFDQLVEAWGG